MSKGEEKGGGANLTRREFLQGTGTAALATLAAARAGDEQRAEDRQETHSTQREGHDVDYAALLARNDIVYRAVPHDGFQGMPLGNGRLGAMVWVPANLTYQVNHNDYWRWSEDFKPSTFNVRGARPVALCHLSLVSHPGLLAGIQSFEQKLSLYDASVQITISRPDGATKIRSFMDMDRDLLVIHWQEEREQAVERSIQIEGWRADSRAIVSDKRIGLEEGFGSMRSPDEEQYLQALLGRDYREHINSQTTLVSVDGVEATAERNGEQRAALRLAKSARIDTTIYLAAGISYDRSITSVSLAAHILNEAQRQGKEKLWRAHQQWWAGFWGKSFVALDSADKTADYVENLWYFHFYQLASSSRGKFPPRSYGANFLYNRDNRSWGGGYWIWVARENYWASYAADHVELNQPFFDAFLSAVPVMHRQTRELWAQGGMFVPETTTPDGTMYKIDRESIYDGKTEFIQLIFSSGMEIAELLYRAYLYSGDEKFLRERVYPFMKAVAQFYLEYLKKDERGQYYMYPTNVHETFWRIKNSHMDLAAIRACFPWLIETSRRFDVDAELRAKWQEVLDHLAPFPLGKVVGEGDQLRVDTSYDVYAPGEFVNLFNNRQRRNTENGELFSIYPMGLTGLGTADYARGVRTYEERAFRIAKWWEPSPVQAARLGLSLEARKGILEMITTSQLFPCGFTSEWMPEAPWGTTLQTGDVAPEGNGIIAVTVNEMLLQSYHGVIRVFPAWPKDWDATFRLRAEGGYRVKAQIRKGEIQYVQIESLFGRAPVVMNPWNEPVTLWEGPQRLAELKGERLEWKSQSGHSYLLRPARMGRGEILPLGSRPANNAPKTFGAFVGTGYYRFKLGLD